MTKEELESFDNLYTDLEDIDDLDMGLEIISYKIRKTMQDFANTLLKQSFELQAYKKLVEENFEIIETSDLKTKSFIVAKSLEAQKFKDKEDKLREYIKNSEYTETDFEGGTFGELGIYKDILQILNEGVENDKR
jgi:hypothetical protein